MQMIAAIVGGKKPIRMLGVAHHGVEIDHRVKVARSVNPKTRATSRACLIADALP